MHLRVALLAIVSISMSEGKGLSGRKSHRVASKRLSEARSQSPEFRKQTTPSQDLDDSKGSSIMPARHVQLSLLFGSRLVQSIMRMAMGPLLVSICDDLECTATSKGQLLSGFSLGYLTSQVAGGALADRIGAKAVVLLATVLGALLTAGAGFSTSVTQLWLAQVLLGVSQGPLFPTSIAFLAKWIPPEERALASTVLDTGITVGSLVALPCSGLLAAAYGWRATFVVYGALGLAFALSWSLLACPSPDQCAYISAGEKAYLQKATKQQASGKDKKKDDDEEGGGKAAVSASSSAKSPTTTVAVLLTHASVWSIFISHMAFNLGVYFLTSWTPTYYKDVLGVRPEAAGLAFSIPPTCNCLVKLFINTPLETHLRKKRGFSTLQCRRFFSVVGFVGSTVGLLMVPIATKTYGMHGATAGFALALGAAALHPAGFKANYMDISRASGGVVSGFGNTLASVASFASPLAVGAILSASAASATEGAQGGWAVVFGAIGTANALAAFLFGTLSSATPID